MRALAHVVQNKVEAAYARSDLFERRRRLMDGWSAYVTKEHHAYIWSGLRSPSNSSGSQGPPLFRPDNVLYSGRNEVKSMSHALNFHPVGGLEAIVKFLNLGGLTALAKVREIVREAKLDVHLRHVVFMN